jgi:hypothetical protein
MNCPTKRLVNLLALVLFSAFTGSCGGGSDHTTPAPPPPAAKFSNASLSGQYAFSMTGSEICSNVSSIFTRAGSFFADGSGNITNGLEDINVCAGVETLQFTGGRYSIGADGRGTLELTNSTGTTNYSIVLSSNVAGSIVQTDVDSTASGSFQRQNTAAFSNAAIAGGYVFDFNGVDVNVNPASYVGRFDADGAGSIANGLFDSNIGGTLSGQQLFPTGAFYQLDTNGDGATFGRGTANIAGQSFAFYVVDATKLKFIGTDFPSAVIGDAFAQQNISFTNASVAGSFAFLISGWSSSGRIATAGRFTADGAGNLSSVVLDENNNGSITLLPSGTVTGTFAVDDNGYGGGVMTWTDTNVGSFSFIFYLISPTQAVFQETDSNIVSDGKVASQTATPISAASLAGDYTVGWNGVSSDEEDFVGQLTLTSSGSLSGSIDFNEFGAGQQFFDIPFTGALSLSGGDGTQANTLNANVPTSATLTLHFTNYVIDQNTSFLVGVDNDRVIAGTLTRQP